MLSFAENRIGIEKLWAWNARCRILSIGSTDLFPFVASGLIDRINRCEFHIQYATRKMWILAVSTGFVLRSMSLSVSQALCFFWQLRDFCVPSLSMNLFTVVIASFAVFELFRKRHTWSCGSPWPSWSSSSSSGTSSARRTQQAWKWKSD